jgi:ATP-dependent DNA helicase RecQ
MKTLIVAKTRRGVGACVGGITEKGQSIRLVAADADTNEHAGLEYGVGEVWDLETAPAPEILPPHVENLLVLSAHKLRRSEKLTATVERFMPPFAGGPEGLFDGLLQPTAAGALYITEKTGVPQHSTMFWRPDKPLQLDCSGKRIRYRYPTTDGGRALVFVGFQEPLQEIPAGTLLRVSLAHWWRPRDLPDEPLRCFAQLSGWILASEPPHPALPVGGTPGEAEPPLSALMRRALQELKQTFGFSQFLPVQQTVITRVVHGQDALAVMPTGGGKSLCYQLPALLFPGLTVVVSPLVALMHDQVRQLHELEVAAACLNHTVANRDYAEIMQGVRNGRIKILYVAPETLLRPEILLLLEQSSLACLAIDEAHCVSSWGHDFRPEYRQLESLRARFPSAVCLALTATATDRVRTDIRRVLQIPPEGEFVASFNRHNLFLAVESRHDGLAQILKFLDSRRGQCGIIYCGTRKQADELSADLASHGWPALPYHAGLEDEVRRRNQERFQKDDAPLMVATIAFGMGINKPNVRFVIHAHLPKDLESYYQEIGRAGRDGLPANCLLLYSRGDAVLHRHFIETGAESERPGRQARLQALMRFAETRECRRLPLLAYFGEGFTPPCGQCDRCVQGAPSGPGADATAEAMKFLKCVQATGQVFGQAHIIAVLRGSRAERVVQRRHDQLDSFGTGREHPEKTWRMLAQEFIQLGLLEQELEFGGLRLTPAGGEVLAGKTRVEVPQETRHGSAAPTGQTGPVDSELFEKLRILRRELADESNLPPFMIFGDRALIEMATSLPRTEPEFLAINGVGAAKLANYGTEFLEAIRAHCESQGLPANATPPVAVISATPGPLAGRRFQEVGALFRSGQGLEQIANRYQGKAETVVQNLHRYVAAGGQLDPERVLSQSALPPVERDRALSEFSRLGLEKLQPVHEALGGTISYAELHLLRLYLLCRQPQAPP